MPNLRTFMVLKILVGEKNAASPAPPRQQLLQLRLHALPIAAFTDFKKKCRCFFWKAAWKKQ
jgi:hypothetical protein